MEWITKIILISAFTGILAEPIANSPAENETCTTDSSESATPNSANFTDTNSTNQSTDSTNTTAGISTVESQMLQSKSVAKKDLFSEPGTTVITMSFDSSSIAKEIVDDNASQSASIEITTGKLEESQPQKDYVESASRSEMPVSEISDSSSSPEASSAPQISSMNGPSTDQVSSSSSQNLKQYSSSQFTTVEPSEEFSSVTDVSEKTDEEKSDVLHSAVKRSLEGKSAASLTTEKEGISDPQTKLSESKSKEHSVEHTTEAYSEGEHYTDKHQSELTFSPSLPTGDSSFLYSTADLSNDNKFSETSVLSTVAKLSADGTTTSETTFISVPESKTETAPVNISESLVRAHTEEPKDQNEDSNQAPEMSVSRSTTISEDNSATNTESDTRNTASSSINAETAVNEETNDITHSPEEISKDSTSETQAVFGTRSSMENAEEKTAIAPKADELVITEKNKTNPKPEIRSRGERSSESKVSEIRVLPPEASTFLGDSIIKEKSSSATPENRDLGYTSVETVILSNNSITNANDPQENVSAAVVPFAKSEYHTASSNTSGSSATRDLHHIGDAIRRSHLSEVHAIDLSTKTSALPSQYSSLPMRDKTTPEITTSTSHDQVINNTPLNKSNIPELKTIGQPEIIRDAVVPDGEFSNSNILPTDENSTSLMATSKEEWSSSMNSIATEIPSVKFQDLDTLLREHISNSILDSKMKSGLATENLNIQETSQTPPSETEKGGSVNFPSPTTRMDEIHLNYSPSELVYKEQVEAKTKLIQERKPTRTTTVDQAQPEAERFSIAEHADDRISNHSSTFSSQSISNSYPVSPIFVQPTHISFENSSVVSAVTENRVQLMASDVETSDVIDSGELPVAPLIPVNLHPTPESNKTTIAFVPTNESIEIPFPSSSASEKVGATSGKVSVAESIPGHNNENMNSAFPTRNQDSNNSSTVKVEVKTSISEEPPLQKAENQSEITAKVISPLLIEASATPKTEQQNSESSSPPTEEPPMDSTNSSGIAPTPSSTETTTRRFAVRKPKIRLNGDSDTFTTSLYARRIATSTRKPTLPNSGPPVSIFRKNRTRIGYITSSTTPRSTSAYSVRRASFRPVHIVGTETFPFSLPPMTTLPTPTTTEEEEEEEEEEIEEEDIVELKEDHSTNEGQVPTISEDEEIIVVKYSASLVVNKGIRWKKQLNSRPSPEYKREEKRMRQTLERIFRGSSVGPSIYKIEIDGFSEKYPKSRLIIVDYSVYVLKTDNPPNTADLIQAFNERLVNDSFSRYTFSPENTFIEYLSEERLNKPTESPEMEPPIPQWAIAVIVIGAASFIFIVLFAAVTVYGRHHMRRRYTSKLDDELERSVDSRDWEKKLGTAAAYENLAADVVYDVDDCGTGVDNVKRSYFLD